MSQPIPYHSFGGRGPLIHFAHANGYPPACYRQSIEPLLDQYQVIGMCQRPLWPGSIPEEMSGWQVFADDMIRFFDQQGMRDVTAIGHSLGAVATAHAALKRPDLFRRLILVEPVFLPPAILEMVAAHPDAKGQLPLVASALRRRNHWPDRPAAFERFRRKSVFKPWSDSTLWDYVNSATVEAEGGGVALRFPREWEARIYAHPPLDVWQVVPSLTRPTLGLRGAASDTLSPEAWKLWQELQPEADFVELPDVGHMLLMEQPRQVAAVILDHLAGDSE